MRDPYKTLGVPREARQEAIKQAYRRLAMELHPDRNPDNPPIADKFKDVNAAYALVGDVEKRARFDRGDIDTRGRRRTKPPEPPQARTSKPASKPQAASKEPAASPNEQLHENNRCRALFATHYHELTTLTNKLDKLRCHTMQVKEWNDDIVFLHEVAPGAADRSYGIHVGKLAGLPDAVITRAEQVLETIEQGEQSSSIAKLADDLPLFAASPSPASAQASAASSRPSATSAPSPLGSALDDVHPDEMTPKEALELLYTLKRLLKDESSES